MNTNHDTRDKSWGVMVVVEDVEIFWRARSRAQKIWRAREIWIHSWLVQYLLRSLTYRRFLLHCSIFLSSLRGKTRLGVNGMAGSNDATNQYCSAGAAAAAAFHPTMNVTSHPRHHRHHHRQPQTRHRIINQTGCVDSRERQRKKLV